MSAWDPMQVRMFAKQIVESDEGKAWPVLGAALRGAIISHHVLMVVFSQRGSIAISVDEVRELRNQIEECLADRYKRKVQA